MVALHHTAPDAFFKTEARMLLVAESTKAIWGVELDLLQEFDRVCRKYEIRYFVNGGTLLGALRHRGFIPWDDDLDVNMLRDDFERLCRVAAEEFVDPYFFQTNQTERGSGYGFARLRNSNTAAIMKKDMRAGKCLKHHNQGIFIDIFPLDKLPDDAQTRASFIVSVDKAQKRFFKIRQSETIFETATFKILFHPLQLKEAFKGLFLWLLRGMFGVDLVKRAYMRYELLAKTYNDSDAKDCAQLTFLPLECRRIYFPCANYEKCELRPFEYLQVPVPLQAEEYLQRQYGEWRRHVVAGNYHGGILFDVDKSYTAYF